ncbi:MAG: Zn-dependent alcohol dehydrogenase [Acidimicrobiales bacterium]
MPRAAVCTGLNKPLEVLELDLAAPKANEIEVRMAASGVCHSDLSVQNGTLYGAFPLVLGHEGAGIVAAVGPGVRDFAVDDHVVLSWVPQCGECFFCSKGQGYLCEVGMLGMATGGLLDGTPRFSHDGHPVMQMACTGTFSERVVVPAIGAVKIEPDIPLEVAALVGCGVLTGAGAALNTADIVEGDSVAVVGCGGVGLNTIQGAAIAGATTIIAVDMFPNKLELAARLGATHLVNAAEGDPVAAVLELTEGRGVDVAFEVIGLKATIDQTIAMARRGGQAVLVGVPRMEVMLETAAFFNVVLAAKTIKGCWYGSANVQREVPRLLGYYKDGRLKLDELISRRIGLDEVNDAFRAIEAGEVARTVIDYTR